MKAVNVTLLAILVLLVVALQSKSRTSNSVPSTLVSPPTGTIVSMSQEDILVENRGDPNREMDHFPYPASTSTSKSLSTNNPENLSTINQGLIFQNPDTIVHVRDNDVSPQESHFPKYYRKDTLSGNTIGSSEYKFAETDSKSSSRAWSDKNVSQYPTFYTSQLKDEITNVGAFFDVNNNLVDSTNPRSIALTGDVCYKTKEGEHVCLDNSRQYNPPPALVSDRSNCGFLNSIGLLEYSNLVKEDGERVNNGGNLYGQVKGSKKHNEVFSKPLQPEVLSCQI